jgi:urate oxidase
MIKMISNTYGKADVRLMKLTRGSGASNLMEVTVDILLEGDMEAAHISGDNTKVLPTDTMKNMVYALAREHEFETSEEFGLLLAEKLLAAGEQIHRAQVQMVEREWRNMELDSGTHPHNFIQTGGERQITHISHDDAGTDIVAGIEDLVILKSAQSGFSNFFKDKYTTLKDTDDRVFATNLESSWAYNSADIDFAASRKKVRMTLLEEFAAHDSLSVQHTLYAMGKAVLEKHKEVEDIHIFMPNKHCIKADLSAFGFDNPNQIYYPIEEPSGIIEAHLSR